MFGLGITELLVIMVIVLLIFGVNRLPEIGSGLGKAIRDFKGAISDMGKPAEETKKEDEKKNNSGTDV